VRTSNLTCLRAYCTGMLLHENCDGSYRFTKTENLFTGKITVNSLTKILFHGKDENVCSNSVQTADQLCKQQKP
jgi:hypothetical protein